jgi:uncharacterized protein YndB with AHSA1/START domain
VTATATITPSLTLVRRLKAPPEKVFAAWTDPKMMALWFGPHGTHVDQATADVRVGGGFRVVIVEDRDVRAGAGARHQACGTYTAIEPPRLLGFDWWWQSTPERVSHVTVTLRPVPEGTELTLLHEKFADEATATRHVRGWTESLERLATMFDTATAGR